MIDNNNRKIGLVGITPLLAVGLQNFLKDYNLLLENTDRSGERKYQVLIIGESEYFEDTDFWHSKNILIFLLNEKNTTKKENCISLYDSRESIYEKVSKILKMADASVKAHDNLSTRELDVLREIAAGKTFKEIAEALNISVNTVVTHRKSISAKLGIRSTSGLSVYAMMHNLV